MRKPRDLDSDLKALNERAKLLRERKLRQLGELVIATGADALPIEELAGVLLAALGAREVELKEGWRARGAAFFRGKARGPAARTDHDAGCGETSDSSAQSPAGEAGA